MIKVFQLEKLKVLKDALQSVVKQDPDLEWVGSGESTADFLRIIRDTSVDVLIIDPEVCPGCLNFCNYLSTTYPDINLMIHSPFRTSSWVNEFKNVGVRGFVSKNSGLSELIEAIKSISLKDVYMCALIISSMNLPPHFTPRERQVLRLLARGFSSHDIADKLFISMKTVESHRKNISEKANAKNTAELIGYVSKHGFLFE